jgi:hypothetical protein
MNEPMGGEGETEEALAHSEPGDEPATAAEEGTLSAGEEGVAADASPADNGRHDAEVIIGEIPDADDHLRMLWTARCSSSAHDLLGQFDTREQAEEAAAEHMEREH